MTYIFMNREELLLAIEGKTYCRMKASRVHGVGVFAIRKIGVGVNPFEDAPKEGDIIHKVRHEELEDFDQNLKNYIYDMYISDSEFVYLESITPNNLPIYYRMNHSNSPNIIWDKNAYCFMSIEEVDVDQELLINYSKY